MKATQDKGSCILNPDAVVKLPTKAALPPGEGPKLSLYGDVRQPVEFLELISNPESSAHSHVFKVKIDSKYYALKMFHFYDPIVDFYNLNDRQRYYLRYADLLYHLDPFFAECRAYGRINETKRRRDKHANIVVQAFGYLSLPAKLEDELLKFGIDEWNRPDDEYQRPHSRRSPFRAIVKELVLGENKWDARTSRKMLRNLRELRKMGIYNMDVKADNYMGNRLVDFSVSCTEPSMMLRTKPKSQEIALRVYDLNMFDEMMEEQGVANAPRAVQNREYCKKLRSHGDGDCPG